MSVACGKNYSDRDNGMLYTSEISIAVVIHSVDHSLSARLGDLYRIP